MGSSCTKPPRPNGAGGSTGTIKRKNSIPVISNCGQPNLKLSKSPIQAFASSTFMNFYGPGCGINPGQLFNLKTFKGNDRTQTQWIKEQSWIFPINMKGMSLQKVLNRSFQQKLYWFRTNIQTLRVSWKEGSQTIKVDRSNILMSSKQQLEKINLRKQVKIVFNDEIVDDAGGLLRQWMHLTVKQIFNPECGIFEMTDCKELAYKLKWDDNLDYEYVTQNMKVLGLIIGKAIFDRISINCYLDRTLLRQICAGRVHLQDVYSYDQSIYKTLNTMLSQPNAQQLGLDFCVYHSNPGQTELKAIDLVNNGSQTMLTDANKQKYAKLLIQMYCSKSCEKYLKTLRQYIYKVVPECLLSVFQPIQLEMILCGPNRIDVKDWKQFTIYEGYKPSDKEVKWFWEFVENLDQEKLRNLLHYVTGTTRVPILGFKYLESNRNAVAMFMIKRVPLQNENPYPKSHTCFNRLELPAYSSKDQMHQCMQAIVGSQLSHFGLS